jgi:hypothetical protein
MTATFELTSIGRVKPGRDVINVALVTRAATASPGQVMSLNFSTALCG